MASPTPHPIETVCIPMHIDAFSLCPGSCDDKNVKIAPYTQPNYTALRLDTSLIQHDVLDHVDFHDVSPWFKNSRMADASKPPSNNASNSFDTLKQERMGVHLSWALPRLYRTARQTGDQQDQNGQTVTNTAPPAYRTMPNRWLVTRHLTNAADFPGAPEFKSWVVESNVVRKLNDGTMPDNTDLESDVAPFVSYDGDPTSDTALDSQTEVFLGQKFDLSSWSESTSRGHLPNLTPMTSTNPFFTDYALHNTNVLSVIDNFAYQTDPTTGEVKYLPHANCDYFVFGWHADGQDDPLQEVITQHGVGEGLSDRLKLLKLQLNDKAAACFGGSKDLTRCFVYGAIYGVVFDINNKQKGLVDDAAANFTKEKRIEPLAIGTTPLDAILTFLEAHKTDASTFFQDNEAGQLATDLLAIASFLYASTDDYDSRVKAQDLISQQNFARSDGGMRWTFNKQPGPDGISDKPPDEVAALIKALNTLNETQAQHDAKCRRLKIMQWDLFAEWWKFVSEYMTDTDKVKRPPFFNRPIDDLRTQIQLINSQIKALKPPLDAAQKGSDYKSAPYPAFSTRTDPTLCVAGLDSGWPSDASDTLIALMKSELPPKTDQINAILNATKTTAIWTNQDMQDTAGRLLTAFLQNSTTQNGIRTPDPNTGDIPDLKTTGFRQWGGGNPFVPLFIEWEGIYYHVMKSDWTVHLARSPVGHAHSQVRYTPNVKLSDQKTSDPKNPGAQINPNHSDFRTVNGRVPILPQPVFSLEAIVRQVLDNNPPGLQDAVEATDPGKGAQDIQDLRDRIRQIKFLSAPLDGLTSHLLTRCEGAHVRPLVRTHDNITGLDDTKALKTALRTGPIFGKNEKGEDEKGFDEETLTLIDTESAQTPYGTLLPFSSDATPFKPVTHGQFVFTKLNIVDKFGQAICLPDQNKRLRNWDPTEPLASKVYPCLSDYLSPDLWEDTRTLNTVFALDQDEGFSASEPGPYPLCPYIQLTPAINQPARINTAFLKQDPLSSKDAKGQPQFSAWREVLDFEQPVWGWMVINYADGGIQFFLADGTFYGELRKGGVDLVSQSKKWLPFNPPSLDTLAADKQVQVHQLQALMDRLEDPEFLQSFFDMINGSIANMPFPPSDYSGFANAVVGKPLALVNVGWSLELSTPALTPQNTYPLEPQPQTWTDRTTTAQAKLSTYNFPLKVGDLDRTYDGVVGYFVSSNDGLPNPTTTWQTLYTYFTASDHAANKDVQIIAGEGQFLPLTPYYTDPQTLASTSSLTLEKAKQYHVTTMVVDPYTPIHGYSPILPTVTLTLPAWSIQQAFQKMYAFFHLGPILTPIDVPPTKSAADANPNTQIKLAIGGKKGTWQWLQPYETETEDPEYASIQVVQDTGTENFRKGPYTFLEGYLELIASLAGAGLAKPPSGSLGGGGGGAARGIPVSGGLPTGGGSPTRGGG